MAKNTVLVTAVALTFYGSLLVAQVTGPNFSGTWVLDPAASGQRADLQVKRIVQHDQQTIAVTHSVAGSAHPTTTWTFGGRPAVQDETDGSTTSMAVSWQDSDLVFAGSRKAPTGAVGPVREVWRLDPDGKTLTVARTMAMGGTEFRATMVFRRDPGQ